MLAEWLMWQTPTAKVQVIKTVLDIFCVIPKSILVPLKAILFFDQNVLCDIVLDRHTAKKQDQSSYLPPLGTI